MITEVVNLLGENGKRELAFELIKKRKTIEATDPTDPPLDTKLRRNRHVHRHHLLDGHLGGRH